MTNPDWKKEGWIRAVWAIREWFNRNDIKLDGVRLTVHLPDTRTQWQVKMSIMQNFSPLERHVLTLPNGTMPADEIELLGIKVNFVNPEKFDVRK